MIKPDKHIDIGTFDINIKQLAADETPEYIVQRLQQAMLEVLNKQRDKLNTVSTLQVTQQPVISPPVFANSGLPVSFGASSSVARLGRTASSSSFSGGISRSKASTNANVSETRETISADTILDATINTTSNIKSAATTNHKKEVLVAQIRKKYLAKTSGDYTPDRVPYWEDIIDQIEKGADLEALIKLPEHAELKEIYQEVIANKKPTKVLTEKILRDRMIQEIEEKYIENEKLEPTKKSYWEYILYKLKNTDITLADILNQHQELFMFMDLVMPEFDSLSDTLKTVTSDKVYKAYRNVYPKLGTAQIYAALGTLRDKKGKSVSLVTKDKKGIKQLKDTSIKFTADSASPNTNWKIYKKDGTLLSTHVDIGQEFVFVFAEYGEFVIEAYGHTAEYKNLTTQYKKAKEGKKSYIAVHIKEPELEKIQVEGIKDKAHLEHDANKEYTFTAIADIMSEQTSAIDITWKHFYKPTKAAGNNEFIELDNIGNRSGTTYTTKFEKPGCYKIEASTNNKTISHIFILGGNYITAIKEKNNKTTILYKEANSLSFIPVAYKLKGKTIKEDKIRWWVKKGEKRIGEIYVGTTFKVSQTKGIDEGVYKVIACVDDPVFGKKYASTEVAIVHPKVRDTYWCDENKEPKVLSGLRGETSHICGKITDFSKRSIDVEVYQENKVIYTLKKAAVTQDDGTFMLCISINDVLNKSKSTTPLTYKIKGSDYVLKDQENVCSSSLELTKKAAIKEAYFMYGNQLLSPIQHAVPYGTKIKIVVEATNMVGMALELELYKAKNRDDHSYNKSSIRTKNKVIINSHGKAIVEFELQKDWAKDHKTHTYLYVGAESDTFGSYFTKEFHSRMVLAYQEGDVLDDGVEIITKDKSLKNIGSWPVEEKFKNWTRKIDSGVEKRHVKRVKTASRNHQGLDINFSGGGNTDIGAPVYATHDGFISFLQDNPSTTAGRHIHITSSDKMFVTRYLHLSKIVIENGQKILKGQKIGELGASYNGKEIHHKMSAHLHYEIRTAKNGKIDKVIDPLNGGKYKGRGSDVDLVDPQDWIGNPSLFKHLITKEDHYD